MLLVILGICLVQFVFLISWLNHQMLYIHGVLGLIDSAVPEAN